MQLWSRVPKTRRADANSVGFKGDHERLSQSFSASVDTRETVPHISALLLGEKTKREQRTNVKSQFKSCIHNDRDTLKPLVVVDSQNTGRADNGRYKRATNVVTVP